jgi:mono/diheme cytochrome c family protein
MTPRILLALAACACACAGVAGCSSDATGGSVDGPELFAKLCSGCHGPTGKPPPAMELRLGVRDLTAPEMRAKITPELVEQQIRRGSQNGLMPAFQDLLKPAQLKALSEYVASPQFLAPH